MEIADRDDVLPRVPASKVGEVYPKRLVLERDPGLVADYARRLLELPPGSVFHEDLDLPPDARFATPGNANGRRTFIVVCRERADVEWPAWLATQVEKAAAEGARVARQASADVWAWIDASKQRLLLMQHPDGPDDLDDDTRADWYAAAAALGDPRD